MKAHGVLILICHPCIEEGAPLSSTSFQPLNLFIHHYQVSVFSLRDTEEYKELLHYIHCKAMCCGISSATLTDRIGQCS